MTKTLRNILLLVFFVVVSYLIGSIFFGCHNINNTRNVIISKSSVPIIRGSIAGTRCYFLIDTGSSISMVDSAFISTNNIYKRHVDPVMLVSYYGSITSFFVVDQCCICLGDLCVYESFHVYQLIDVINAVKQNSGVQIAGVVGMDILRKNNIVIDLSKNIIYS